MNRARGLHGLVLTAALWAARGDRLGDALAGAPPPGDAQVPAGAGREGLLPAEDTLTLTPTATPTSEGAKTLVRPRLTLM